ncbi:MAG: OmpA family protein [Acidobacteriota bacterium]
MTSHRLSTTLHLSRPLLRAVALVAVVSLVGCATYQPRPYSTQRDNTAKGAGIGAAAGAAAALAKGKREADDILAYAAIGAAAGAGVGAYMDHQEERLTRIPGTTVQRLGSDTLLLKFDSDILFAVDSSVLQGGAQSTLYQVADVLLDFPKTAVVVHGHTDASGSEQHNLALSERRAGAVRNVLIREGVAPDRVSAIGSGESMPVASNDTETGRSINRRVEILLRAKAT